MAAPDSAPSGEPREKRHKKSKGGDAEGDDEQWDLGACPEAVQVEGTGNPKAEGLYIRMKDPCGGRPVYEMRSGVKAAYLFFNRKKRQWMIGFEVGSNKNVANLKDVLSKGGEGEEKRVVGRSEMRVVRAEKPAPAAKRKRAAPQPASTTTSSTNGPDIQPTTTAAASQPTASITPPIQVSLPELEVETDTEYPECNLEDYPQRFIVSRSGFSRIDGRYRQLPKPSRGRVAYVQLSDKKTVYMYWRKDKWLIGYDFGSRKSVANVKDAGCIPCEPYPFSWNVLNIDKKKDDEKKEGNAEGNKEEKKNEDTAEGKEDNDDKDKEGEEGKKHHGMNVIIGMRVAEDLGPDVAPRSSAVASVSAGVSSVSAEDGAPKKKKRRETRVAIPKDSTTNTPAATDAHEVSETPAAAAQQAASEEQLSEESSAGDSDSDSNTSMSSASSSSSSRQQKVAKLKAQAEAALAKAAMYEKMMAQAKKPKEDNETMGEEQKKRNEQRLLKQFETRLREELTKITSTTARAKKLSQVRAKMQERFSAPGGSNLPPDAVRTTLDALAKEFSISTPPAVSKAGAKPSVKGQLKLNEPTKIDPSSLKSSLKRSGGPKQRVRKIQFKVVGEELSIDDRLVECFRSVSELWYYMPGSIVKCDRCLIDVPQSGGNLTGSPNASMFAQHEFMCNACLIAQHDLQHN